MIQKKVQDVPISEFQELECNDILFIDNLHVSKIGSDVNHLILRILPLLKKDVIVHLHDIFIPYEYPESWVKDKKIFWNEQYLLQAFLLFNNDFEVLMPNYYIGQKFNKELKMLIPHAPHFGGGSFGIRGKI